MKLPRFIRGLGALAALFVAADAALASDPSVGPIALTVANLDLELTFFTHTLPFRLVEIRSREFPAPASAPNLVGSGTRTAVLQLGDERIHLVSHPGAPGRPIPQDSRSFDHWFQHIAIVVGDMDRAYARLQRHKVRHVSTAPQTLPDWNPAAGGIRAFYFLDPEDHVLELICFPPGKGLDKWRQPTVDPSGLTDSSVFIGIDHTAIVVRDTDRSLHFYRDQLGLKVVGSSENWGVEQEHLNQVFGARLRITALRGASGPGIEFLEYLAPPGGRPLPADPRLNDLVAWHTTLHLGSGTGAHPPEGSLARVGSTSLVRDPDGHLLDIRP